MAHSCCLLSFCLHTNGPSSEIKMARRGCEIKIMALKALSSWSSQSQPYGPLGLVLFLHLVLSNMLGEIRVQPACLSVDESNQLWFTTGIHPGCSHSNKLGLMCSAWNDQEAVLLETTFSHLYLAGPWWGDNINICMYTSPHVCCSNIRLNSWCCCDGKKISKPRRDQKGFF